MTGETREVRSDKRKPREDTQTQSQAVTDSHRQSQRVTDTHRQSQTVTDSHRQSLTFTDSQSAFNSQKKNYISITINLYIKI